jgi:hypothetical protein
METNTLIRGGYNKDRKELKPFDKAYGQLKAKDQLIVKSVIISQCKLSDRHFGQKKNGTRGITDREQEIIQSTFQAFGIIWEPVAIQPEPANI